MQRRLIPLAAVALLIGASVWAISHEGPPPADLTFCNGTEIKTIDPAKITGQPEGRVVDAIFEGLCRRDPVDLHVIPGVAERWDVSDDLKTYTFHLRRDAKWTDGSPVTADDFHYSFRRFLSPDTQGEYVYQLWYVKNAKKYSTADVQVGDRVEVELPRGPDVPNTVRGPLLFGTLQKIDVVEKVEKKTITKQVDGKPRRVEVEIKVEVKTFTVDVDGKLRKFCKEPTGDVEKCEWVLPAFETVGVRVDDPYKLTITLENATPFFLDLMAFYPMAPVQRKCLELHGAPWWTRPENVVGNGPFRIESRKIRDRVRLVKNEHYWNRDAVKLNTVDILAVEGSTTMLNMYLTGQVDWITDAPATVAPQLMKEYPNEFNPSPILGAYFYRFNVTKPPFDNPLVRRALTLALDRRDVCETVTRTGQVPALSLVPPGLKGYEPAPCGGENVDEARRLLAEAGYPEGRGFPKIEILYNTQDTHKAIAELIQDRWKRTLGIDVGLRNQEWGVFLDTVRRMEFDTARASWIGDYADPNTFLDMFMSDNENNQTGWSNAEYDRLMKAASSEGDAPKRMQMLHDAEAILMRELPIIPIYFYVSKDMVRPYVRGFHENLRDEHPLWALSIDPEEKRRFLASEGVR